MSAKTSAPAITDAKFTLEFIAVEDMIIDPKCQRPLTPSGISRIDKDFDPDELGFGIVSRRTDNSNVLLDGQHRREVLLRRLATERPNTPRGFVCQVYRGLTPEQEAQKFLARNNTTQPTWLAKFMARITAGDEVAQYLAATAAKWGWVVDGTTGKGKVAALATLERIYWESKKIGADPNLVDVALQVITDAWGTDHDGVRGFILEGVAALLAFNYTRQAVNLPYLTRTLKTYPGGPTGLLASATSNARVRQLRPAMSVADLLTQAYNKGRRGDFLAAWTRRR